MDEEIDVFDRLNKYLDDDFGKSIPCAKKSEKGDFRDHVSEEDLEAIFGPGRKNKQQTRQTTKQKKKQKVRRKSDAEKDSDSEDDVAEALADDLSKSPQTTLEPSSPVQVVVSEPAPSRRRRSGRIAQRNNIQIIAANVIPPQNNARSNNRRTRQRDVFRAFRNHLNEISARLPTVDTVDLISSPIIPVTGTVVIDSDDERQNKSSNGTEDLEADSSFGSANRELRVKVKWMDKIEIHPLRQYQKFEDLIKIFADRHQTELNEVVLNLDDYIIEPTDTPDSINYNICKFISGRILKGGTTKNVTAGRAKAQKRDPNAMEFKIQSDQWKKPLQIFIKKTEQFRILYVKCSEELKVKPQQVKLSFDGEELDMDQTPEEFDMEGGEVIDCRIKS